VRYTLKEIPRRVAILTKYWICPAHSLQELLIMWAFQAYLVGGPITTYSGVFAHYRIKVAQLILTTVDMLLMAYPVINAGYILFRGNQ